MKILVASPTYPPTNTGLGNAVSQQVAYLASQGHYITVATGGIERTTRVSDLITIETFSISGADCLLQPIRGDVASYKKLLLEESWDVVLLNAWQNWATDIPLRYLGKITGRKFLYSHCISTNALFIKQPLRSLTRYLAWRPYWWRLKGRMKSLDGVLFLADGGSDSRFDDLRLAKRWKIPFWIIPNALSPSGLTALQSPSNSLGERNFLITVGSYQWQKGFDFVIKAYAASKARESYRLHIFGQKYTAYTDYLRELVKRVGLKQEDVFFHEGLSGDRLVSEYAKAALMLSGSYTECQPLVLIDANATGTPFIARSTGCIQCMKGGVGVETWQEMSKQIDKILHDEQAWSELANEGLEAAINIYNPSQVGSRLISALTETRDA